MSQELYAPMLADISDAVFGENNAAAPPDLLNAHGYVVCGPVTKDKGETWLGFSYRFMKWDVKPERLARWVDFLVYLKRAGQQYTEGYDTGYAAGAAKARQDYESAVKSVRECSRRLESLLFDLERTVSK